MPLGRLGGYTHIRSIATTTALSPDYQSDPARPLGVCVLLPGPPGVAAAAGVAGGHCQGVLSILHGSLHLLRPLNLCRLQVSMKHIQISAKLSKQ